MTEPAIRQMRAVRDQALADPDINTSAKRAERLRVTVNTLERAAVDVPAEALSSLSAFLDPAVIGHPKAADTVLGRIAAGQYRVRDVGVRLKLSYQRNLMDGLVDLNRAAGQPPFWWQMPGARPWAKHTKDPLEPGGHLVLRRALSTPVSPRREPYRLRLLAALELLWATGVTREGLVGANVTDIAPNRATIRLTWNPPGRTEANEQVFTLPASARAALALWLPVRADVVARHLREGPGHQANQALFITLRHTVGAYDDGSARSVPPGLRITGKGLEENYSMWARSLNAEHQGKAGWPVPTDLYVIARGGADRG
jgi:integrase